MSFGAVYCLYDDHEYLDISVFPVSLYLDKVLFLISDVPWNGAVSDNSETINRVKSLCEQNSKFEFRTGHWTNEVDQRNFGLSVMLRAGIDYSFVIDSDEVYAEEDFVRILQYIEANSQIDAFHLEWNTYWKKSYYRIQPRENFKPLVAVRNSHFLFTFIRGGITSVLRTKDSVIKSTGAYNGVLIPPQMGICHHLSYARSDSYMLRKLETNSHHSEFIPNWYETVWQSWSPQLRNLHPVTPAQYGIAVKSNFTRLPNQLKSFIKKEQGRSCSIIILNWNSCELLKKCIELIEQNTEIPHELIIVDNGSTKDNSVEFIKVLPCKNIFNAENVGFPAGVNQALRLVNNTDVCLLNVDAEVQPGWLENLYESAERNPSIGIIGPLGNQIENGYQAEGSTKEDMLVPNVHGFCMLIMREVIDKIGGFDERYNPGGMEDVDYCMRARLAGFGVVISAKSLVRHKAHQVYDLNEITSEVRGKKDQEHWGLYYEKFYGMFLDYSLIYDFFELENVGQHTGLIVR